MSHSYDLVYGPGEVAQTTVQDISPAANDSASNGQPINTGEIPAVPTSNVEGPTGVSTSNSDKTSSSASGENVLPADAESKPASSAQPVDSGSVNTTEPEPSAQECGQQKSTETEEVKAHRSFLQRVEKLRIVECSLNTYSGLREYPCFAIPISMTEISILLAIAPVYFTGKAIGNMCSTPVRCVDRILCSGLDVIERMLPEIDTRPKPNI